ncbi:hypothetical protein PITC_075620 [Penicillium italicum]|uniref:Uncharacterized protein n=1 Tax=Penicillium italicum TaxID=40296 RepID=A0A0A2KWD8_PENIT|nr:hypothetical protein PITC_075620 [Penicillium italicum]
MHHMQLPAHRGLCLPAFLSREPCRSAANLVYQFSSTWPASYPRCVIGPIQSEDQSEKRQRPTSPHQSPDASGD